MQNRAEAPYVRTDYSHFPWPGHARSAALGAVGFAASDLTAGRCRHRSRYRAGARPGGGPGGRRDAPRGKPGRLALETARPACAEQSRHHRIRSEEHTSELQSLMRISYAVFCLKKKNKQTNNTQTRQHYKTC